MHSFVESLLDCDNAVAAVRLYAGSHKHCLDCLTEVALSAEFDHEVRPALLLG